MCIHFLAHSSTWFKLALKRASCISLKRDNILSNELLFIFFQYRKCIKLIFMSFNKTWNVRKKFPTSWLRNIWEPFVQLPVNIVHCGDNCYPVQSIIIIHLHLNIEGGSQFLNQKKTLGGWIKSIFKWRPSFSAIFFRSLKTCIIYV